MTADQTYLDFTASFTDVLSPTPFGVFDADTQFSTDADGMIRFVNSKLGGSILQVELTNRDVYSCMEQAALEYSGIINSYQARSTLADIIGSETGSLDTHENKLARMNLALAKRRADAFSSEAGVGGTRHMHSASIDLIAGQQNYDLNVLLSASGDVSVGQRAEIKEIFYFSPTATYRFFDTTSAINYLHNQFSFESFTPETVFYLLPIWEDVLRATQLKQSHNIRRSHWSYGLVDNVLKIYPVPTMDTRLHFTFFLNGADEGPFDDADDPLTNGVSNLSNVPFGNIVYSKLNSLSHQWVRRFALACAQETLGQVRSKVQSVPIPNGELNLNGNDLIMQAREDMMNLREELKALLEATTYQALATQQAEEAENLKRQLLGVPMGIYVGVLCLFFLNLPYMGV
jgi:hypothetical protein